MFLLALFGASCGFLFSPADQQFENAPAAVMGSCEDEIISIEEGRKQLNARGGDDEIAVKTRAGAHIQAGSGNDVIYAGTGNDFFEGGPGRDLFVFEGGFGYDQILDFSAPNGDRLMFITYSDDPMSYDELLNHAHEGYHGLWIDFRGTDRFSGARVHISNLKLSQLTPDRIMIRVIDPN